MLSLLISTPFIFFINYLKISTSYKLLILLAWSVLIELISPFINKYRTEEEHDEHKFKYNLQDEKNTIESLAKLPNRQFIFTCLHMLRKRGKLTEKYINILTNRDYCSINFSCLHEILSEVPISEEMSNEYYTDKSGCQRYYPEHFTIRGQDYIVTNYWHGPHRASTDNRTPFVRWVMNLLA